MRVQLMFPQARALRCVRNRLVVRLLWACARAMLECSLVLAPTSIVAQRNHLSTSAQRWIPDIGD